MSDRVRELPCFPDRANETGLGTGRLSNHRLSRGRVNTGRNAGGLWSGLSPARGPFPEKTCSLSVSAMRMSGWNRAPAGGVETALYPALSS